MLFLPKFKINQFVLNRLLSVCAFSMCILTINLPAHGARSAQKFVGKQLIQVTAWNMNDGLPHWSIQDMIETSDGYLWLLQAEELIRFDGSRYERYALPEKAIPFTSPHSLALDKNNCIWIYGTGTSGRVVLYVFNPGTQQFLDTDEYLGTTFQINKPFGSFDQFFQFFTLDNTPYFSSLNGQLWGYNNEWLALVDLTNGKEKNTRILPAPNGFYWALIKENNSVSLINSKGQIINEYPTKCFENSMFWLDQDANLWSQDKSTNEYTLFGADQSLQTFQAGSLPHVRWGNFLKQSKFNRPNSRNYTLNWESGKLTLRHKGCIIDNDFQNFIYSEFGIIPDQLDRPYLLSDDSFVIKGTYGMVRIKVKRSPFSQELHNTSTAMSSSSVRSVGAWNDSSLLITTYNGNFLVDKRSLSTSHAIHLPFTDKNHIGYNSYPYLNNIWIGSSAYNKLKYNIINKKFAIVRPQGDERSIETFDFSPLPASDSFVMASRNGLFLINDSFNTYAPFRFQDTSIYCMETHGVNLWMGTDLGLYNWSEQRFVLTKDNLGRTLKVYHVLPESNSFLWLATNHGLVLWAPLINKTYFFNSSSAYPIPRIHCVYRDQRGRLWMSSNQGLFTLNLMTGSLEVFSEKDGLFSSEFNLLAHYQAPDGHLYFGTVNGLVAFSPDKFDVTPLLDFQHSACIDHISLFDNKGKSTLGSSPITQGSEILSIPRPTSFISIRFSVPHFDLPNLSMYWRIPNVIDTWQTLHGSEINISVPKHGTHSIQLRTHPQGKPSSLYEQELIKFRILPPVYATAWFWMLILALIVALFLILVRLRTAYLLNRQKELQAVVKKQVSEIKTQLEEIEYQKRTLDEINAQKSRFYSNLVHELKTPIAIISGYAQSLSESQLLDPSSRDTSFRLMSNVHDVIDIVEEIHDLISIDKGALKLEVDSIGWPSFLQGVVDDARLIAGKKEQKLYLTSGSSFFYMKTDKAKFHRILSNLLSNAIKYTQREGEIHVTETVQNNQLVLTVKDNGPGIPENEQELVFQRFFRSTNQPEESDTGLGIGLTISKEYTELMGGSLSLISQPGKGAEFVLKMPIHITDATPTPPAEGGYEEVPREIENSAHMVPAPPEGSPYILVVEDNHKMQDYLRHLIGSRAHVITANDGSEALDFLSQNGTSVDLVISDVKMPRMDGFELLREVRKNELNPMHNVPFLLLTALPESEHSLEAFRMGVDGYLSKPFNQQELLARVDNLISRFASRKARNSSVDSTAKEVIADVPNYESAWMKQLRNVLYKNMDDPNFKVNELANELFVSERTLRNKVSLFTGLTPGRLIMLERLNHAYHLLQIKKYATVSEVCHVVGIRNVSHFTKAFKKEFGKLPSDLLK